jgi:hypothetical protein
VGAADRHLFQDRTVDVELLVCASRHRGPLLWLMLFP